MLSWSIMVISSSFWSIWLLEGLSRELDEHIFTLLYLSFSRGRSGGLVLRTYMQVRKQQLELDMEQQTGSK